MANKILAAVLSIGAVMGSGSIGSAKENKEEKTSNSQRRDEILSYGSRYGKKGLNFLKENVGVRDVLELLVLLKIHGDLRNSNKVALGTLLKFVQEFEMEDSAKNFAACDAAQTLLKHYNNESNRQFLLETFIKEEKPKKEKPKKENEEEINENKVEIVQEVKINKGEKEKEKELVKWAEQRASVLSFLFRNFKFGEISEYAGKNFKSLLENVIKANKNKDGANAVKKAKDWKYCVAKAEEFLKFNSNKYKELDAKSKKLTGELEGLDKEADKDLIDAKNKELKEIKEEMEKLKAIYEFNENINQQDQPQNNNNGGNENNNEN